MTKNNLKRYLLLSNGNQIDQKYTTLEDSDFVQKGNKLLIIINYQMITLQKI